MIRRGWNRSTPFFIPCRRKKSAPMTVKKSSGRQTFADDFGCRKSASMEGVREGWNGSTPGY